MDTGPFGRLAPRAGSIRALVDAVGSFVDRRFFSFAVLPALVIVLAVTVVPLVAGIGLSFSSINSVNVHFFPLTLYNYQFILHDTEVQTVLANTGKYVVIASIVETLIGVAVAVMLTHRRRYMVIFRVIFLLPIMVPPVASAVAWTALFNTSEGWVNYFLGGVGLHDVGWLTSPHLALASVVIADMWSGVSVVSVIVLAALLSVPGEPLEAAKVDGASAWQTFVHVTLPAIQPAVILAFLLRVVGAFQQFALFQLMTGGGPGLDTTVLNFYSYQQTFVFNNLAYGAALAILLMVSMVAILVVLFVMLRRSRVNTR